MSYIVMDLEWNQPVSKNSYPYLKIGDKLSNEIIQIGAYKVSENFEIVDSFCAYIKPKYYKKLNSFVKRVTNIDKEMIGDGEALVQAIERFKNWCGEDFSLFTWGSDDIFVMKQNLEFYGIDMSFITSWYDMQTIFSNSYLKENSQRSLSFAMEFLSIEESEERHLHDALDDAYYTACIFVRHDIEACILNYSYTSDFKTLCSELDDMKFGGFYTRKKAMADKNVKQIICPVCKKNIDTYGEWLSLSGKYVCMATCQKHGDFISRIKLNKHLDGKFYVNKITKKASAQMSEELKKRYEIQKQKVRRKKKQAVNAV